MNQKFLSILNFVGSVCSIAALLIVIFNDISWLKGFNIILSVIWAICLSSAITYFIYPLIRRLDKYGNAAFMICTYIAGALLIFLLTAFIFWGFYCILASVEELLEALIKSI